MRSEQHRSVEHALHSHVVDICAHTNGKIATLVLHPAGADAAIDRGRMVLTFGQRLDGFENFYVSGTPAQVASEVTAGFILGQCRTLLVDEGFRPHHNSRCTKATLQRPTGGERVGVPIHFANIEAFERADGLSGDAVERHGARNNRLTVDQYGATPTLSLRRAAVFGRRDIQFLSQSGEEMGVASRNGDGLPIHHEGYSRCVDGIGRSSHERPPFVERNFGGVKSGEGGGSITPFCETIRP